MDDSEKAIRERAWWSCDWQTQFETFRRMDDGVSDGLDRTDAAAAIRALGNTVVTVIPELIGKAILEAEGA